MKLTNCLEIYPKLLNLYPADYSVRLQAAIYQGYFVGHVLCNTIEIDKIQNPKQIILKTISEVYVDDKVYFESRSLEQVISFSGEGKLRDGNNTSEEFRDLVSLIPTKLLITYIDYCLDNSFKDSGIALQDLINEVGNRIGFKSTFGRYRGTKSDIGFDGLWKTRNGYSFVVEVKTTDAYRINLDTLNGYKNRLIKNDSIDVEDSSILIVVGREDTGDLEAQVRGSKFAWDVRLISITALLQLLLLKERLNDVRIFDHINQLLRPTEYTRVDNLIDLIFETSKDADLDDINIDDIEGNTEDEDYSKTGKRFTPVSFHESCIQLIEKSLNIDLHKVSRITWSTRDGKVSVKCSISKQHQTGNYNKYWFAFHPHQKDYLDEQEMPYMCFGLGEPSKILLFPYHIFKPMISNMWTTENDTRMYWHVVILERNGKIEMQQPILRRGETIDVTEYLISTD